MQRDVDSNTRRQVCGLLAEIFNVTWHQCVIHELCMHKCPLWKYHPEREEALYSRPGAHRTTSIGVSNAFPLLQVYGSLTMPEIGSFAVAVNNLRFKYCEHCDSRTEPRPSSG